MKSTFAGIIAIAILFSACGTSAADLIADGNAAFDNQAYDVSLQSYLEAQGLAPELAEPAYNAANVHYRNQDYENALQFLQQALRNAEGELTGSSFYNLGNTLFSTQQLEAAIEAYKDTLRINPDDMDAKHNLELALQQLQQQQEQEQQDEQQENQEEQDEQPEESQEQQNQSTQDQQDGEQQEQGEEDQNQPAASEEASSEEDAQPVQQPSTGLTEEQAEQLLETIGQSTQTLQERLQQMYVVPGPPPAKDW